MGVEVGIHELTPRVQQGQYGDFGFQAFPLPGQLENRLGAGAEHQRIERLRIGQREQGYRTRRGHHHVVVFHRQQAALDLVGPLAPIRSLARWAMAIVARVEELDLGAARIALPPMKAHDFGAADHQLSQHPVLLHGELMTVEATILLD